jgi:hypothetical protein
MFSAAIVFAVLLAFGLSTARTEDEVVTTLCVGTIQKIQGNLWTVNAPLEPICRARILSRQVKGGILMVCKIGQKRAFAGNIIPRNGSIDPYWDTIEAEPVR